MTPQVFLVTNAHAGLGLELCRALLAKDLETVVIAAVPALAGDDELAGMERRQPGRLERIQMDGGDAESVAAAAEACSHLCFARRGIDVLIDNATAAADGPAGRGLDEGRELGLAPNVAGTANVVNAFLPLLRKGSGKAIWLGAPSCEAAGAAAHAASCAALRMYAIQLAATLAPEGFRVEVFDPGHAAEQVAEAGDQPVAKRQITWLLDAVGCRASACRGTSFDHEGKEIPW